MLYLGYYAFVNEFMTLEVTMDILFTVRSIFSPTYLLNSVCNIFSSRTSRRLNAVAKEPMLWKTIDLVEFYERSLHQRTDKGMKNLVRPLGRVSTHRILLFLHVYGKHMVKLRLPYNNPKVLSYIDDYCHQLEELDLKLYSHRSLSTLTNIPNNLVSLQIDFPRNFGAKLYNVSESYENCGSLREDGFLLSPFDHLREITLRQIIFDNRVSYKLSQMTHLRQLHLLWCVIKQETFNVDTRIKCGFLKRLNSLKVDCCLFSSLEDVSVFLVEIAKSGSALLMFSFQMPDIELLNDLTHALNVNVARRVRKVYRHMFANHPVDFGPCLSEFISAERAAMRYLYFRGNFVSPDELILDVITRCFNHLRGISIGNLRTIDYAPIIVRNMKMLRIIDLGDGEICAAIFSACFSNHGFLEALRVCNSRHLSCEEICEVVKTLPRIKVLCTTPYAQLEQFHRRLPSIVIIVKIRDWIHYIDRHYNNV